MLKQFKYIQNVGRYRRAKGTDATLFQPLTLVFSENGRGKTTLCAILRSLSDGTPNAILSRKRLDNDEPARVVIELDSGDVAFDGATWTAAGPDIRIFDEHFVDENVYSGLSVEASHRQNVHGLVLGTEGVRLQKRVEQLTAEVAALQTTIREQETQFSRDLLNGLSVDEFCALQGVEEIEENISEAARAVAVLEETETVGRTAGFQHMGLPLVDITNVEALLGRTLPDLDREALEAVASHVALLGADAERWISQGERLRRASSSCPYCGQEVGGSPLVAHYRAYFSTSYNQHKANIEALASRVSASLSGDALAAFERSLHAARESARFWTRFVSIPEISADSGKIASSWALLRDVLIAALDAKSRAPLETIAFSEEAREALRKYDAAAEEVRAISDTLVGTNEHIDAAKEQAGHGNLNVARGQLSRLRATRERITPETDALCAQLLSAKRNKAIADERRAQAREALNEQRELVFAGYQTKLNQALLRLNAEFSIEGLKPSDKGRGGVPSTTYGIGVNQGRVELAASAEPAPSFKTALSAGDRNALALAFFLASIEGKDLSNSIVVIDDPASSLDEGRSLKTVQQIRRIADEAKQVVVLSHSETLLGRLWEKADQPNTATLQLRTPQGRREESVLETWDAEAAATTEHDRLFALVKGFATSHSGAPQAVATDLRLFLESFFRAAFPDCFYPSEQLGTFTIRCRELLGKGSQALAKPLIDELDELREYANQFHHATNKGGHRAALANINETALGGYCRQAIALIERVRSGS